MNMWGIEKAKRNIERRNMTLIAIDLFNMLRSTKIVQHYKNIKCNKAVKKIHHEVGLLYCSEVRLARLH